MKFLIILLLVLLSFSIASGQSFEGCGYVAMGVECPVFLADGGGYYSLTNFGGFQAGDYVSVKGNIDSSIISICMQGPWIVVESINSCLPVFDQCGEMFQGTECLMFKSSDDILYAVTDTLMNPLEGLFDGDTVHIVGLIIYTFASVCQQEQASIIVSSVSEDGCYCTGMRGNLNGDKNDIINISDLTYFVAYIFKGGSPPLNKNEADVNANGEITIVDLTYFIRYMFKNGPEPRMCP